MYILWLFFVVLFVSVVTCCFLSGVYLTVVGFACLSLVFVYCYAVVILAGFGVLFGCGLVITVVFGVWI